MKLANPNSSFKIIFEDNKINILILENPLYLRQIIYDLLNQEEGLEGELVLSIENKEIEMSKNIYIITDYFHLDINNRKILNKIYKDMEESIFNEDNFLETNEFKSYMINYIDNMCMEIDYPISYDVDIDFKQLFKSVNIKVEEEYENDFEKLLDYIDIVKKVFNTKLFVFLNLKSFLSVEEYKELYKFINYNKLKILLIENEERKTSYDWEIIRIVDKDMCEIY